MQIDMIADYACDTGEGPLWHPQEKRLYWTDIPAGKLFRFDPETEHHEVCYEGRPVGGFTIQADGSLLLFRDKGNIVTWKDGKELSTVVESIPRTVEQGGRFNDVIADPEGRVFCGTLGPGGGELYRLDRDASLTLLIEDVKCSNGMDFTEDRKLMYFTDSGRRTIDLFDYDQNTGSITNRRNLITVPEGEGVPDGMTRDAAGNIWSARWDGHGVFCYSPQGKLIRKVGLPAPKCSCVTFCGQDMADMYVTTAGGKQKGKDGPTAGALYRVRGHDAKGHAEFFSRIGL